MNRTEEPVALAPDLELDGFIAAFEEAWFHNGAADIAAFAPPADHPRRLDILAELIRVDLELAWGRGDERLLEQYRASYPELFQDRARLQSLAMEERRLRWAAGETPDSAEYLRRFGIDPGGSVLDSRHAATMPHVDIPVSEAPVGPHGAADRMPTIGETVSGFLIESELGHGAFGRVFLARQTDLADRRVALKVSSKFPGEAGVLAKLQHANIVPIYSIHRLGRFHVVCMPFLGAATLVDWLREFRKSSLAPATGLQRASTLGEHMARTVSASSTLAGPASTGESPDPITGFPPSVAAMYAKRSYAELVLWMGAELADGLAHAHERGILHRDLKPANILLTDDGRPMLLDFNLAASTDDPRQSTTLGGTPRYMAPEQLAGMLGGTTTIDARADTYALGLLLCEMLTGELPFPNVAGEGHDLIAQMLLDRSGAAPRIHRPGLSPAVASILSTTLDPDPDRRYPSAAALRDDLRRQLDHQPLAFARDPSLRERLSKWARRHPRLSSSFTLSSVALIVLAAVVAGFMVRHRHVARLESEHQLVRLVAARAEVSASLADGRGPTGEVVLAAQRATEALASVEGKKNPSLSDAQRQQWQSCVAELNYYQARADLLLAGRTSSSERESFLDHAWNTHESAWSGWPESSRPVMLVAQRAALLRERGQIDAAKRVLQDASAPEIAPDSRAGAKARLRELEGGARLHSANASYWLSVGRLHASAGDLVSARGCFRVAAELDPDSPWPPYHDGIASLESKDFAAAERAFTRVIERHPTVGEAFLNRAVARVEQRNFPAAIADLTHIEHEALRLPRLYFVREIARRAVGDARGADQDRDAGLKLSPHDAPGWSARGEAWLRLTPPNLTNALRDFRRAIEVDPEFRTGYENQAAVLSERMGNPAEAVAVLDQAVNRFPEYALARSSRAVLLARLGRRDEARRDADAALKLDPAPLHCYQAACVYLLTGDRDRAVTLLRRALRADPSWATYMPGDPDLKAIRQTESFAHLMRAAQELLRDDAR